MLDLLLPRRCAVCGTDGTALCDPCARSLPAAPERPPPPGLDACCALLAYDGPVRDLVAQLKYRNHRGVLQAAGRALAVLLRDLVGQGVPDPVVVSWAPTSAQRRRRRGYDQAELLARRAAAPVPLPVRGLLRRETGAAQTGADRAHRLDGPSFRSATIAGGTVVVIDDVWTTGATLSAAARALRSAGADHVVGLVLATRP